MEGHPVVAPNGAARVSKRFRNSTESRGHGTRAEFPQGTGGGAPGAKTSGTDGSVHAARRDSGLRWETVGALGRSRQSPHFRGAGARRGRKLRGQTAPSTRRGGIRGFRWGRWAPWDGVVSPRVFAERGRGRRAAFVGNAGQAPTGG
jgi:hypothetical protein